MKITKIKNKVKNMFARKMTLEEFAFYLITNECLGDWMRELEPSKSTYIDINTVYIYKNIRYLLNDFKNSEFCWETNTEAEYNIEAYCNKNKVKIIDFFIAETSEYNKTKILDILKEKYFKDNN